MISLHLILWLLLAHWVGDAVLQSGAVAVRKGKSLATLTYHVTIYTITLALFVALRSYPAVPALLFVGVNGAAHWLTDLITSRINGRLWRAGTATTPPDLHWFFVSVLFDQLVHTSTLVLTAACLLS